MFITNYNSLPSSSVIWVSDEEKKYLESLGFCVLSEHNEKWAFTKTDEIINILKSQKGGNDG